MNIIFVSILFKSFLKIIEGMEKNLKVIFFWFGAFRCV